MISGFGYAESSVTSEAAATADGGGIDYPSITAHIIEQDPDVGHFAAPLYPAPARAPAPAAGKTAGNGNENGGYQTEPQITASLTDDVMTPGRLGEDWLLSQQHTGRVAVTATATGTGTEELAPALKQQADDPMYVWANQAVYMDGMTESDFEEISMYAPSRDASRRPSRAPTPCDVTPANPPALPNWDAYQWSGQPGVEVKQEAARAGITPLQVSVAHSGGEQQMLFRYTDTGPDNGGSNPLIQPSLGLAPVPAAAAPVPAPAPAPALAAAVPHAPAAAAAAASAAAAAAAPPAIAAETLPFAASETAATPSLDEEIFADFSFLQPVAPHDDPLTICTEGLPLQSPISLSPSQVVPSQPYETYGMTFTTLTDVTRESANQGLPFHSLYPNDIGVATIETPAEPESWATGTATEEMLIDTLEEDLPEPKYKRLEDMVPASVDPEPAGTRHVSPSRSSRAQSYRSPGVGLSNVAPSGQGQRRLRVYEFLYKMLCDDAYNPSHIRWAGKPEDRTFKIVNSKEVAQAWFANREGCKRVTQKYEHFSRTLRHCYKNGLLEQVDQRLTYRFGKKSGFPKPEHR